MEPRLDQLDRVDRWLLSQSRWQLRRIALLIALTINVPVAWAESRMPVDLDTMTTESVGQLVLSPGGQ
jgi:hypothetical protein